MSLKGAGTPQHPHTLRGSPRGAGTPHLLTLTRLPSPATHGVRDSLGPSFTSPPSLLTLPVLVPSFPGKTPVPAPRGGSRLPASHVGCLQVAFN